MNLDKFNQLTNLHDASLDFFTNTLNIKISAFDSKPIAVADFFKDPKKMATVAVQNITQLYIIGLVDDKTLKNQKSDIETVADASKINKDYNGLILAALSLKNTPTRSQLAELTRLVNRSFPYLPVTIIFRYENKISFANAERVAYLQPWREGEKVGKISMLKDIDIAKPHGAHQKILNELQIPKQVSDFDGLYKHWQKKLSTKELNDDFYLELFKWYLWAKDNITFPNGFNEDKKNHAAESVIRFISRLLFVWFMKEKKLIGNNLFEATDLQNILKDFDKSSTDNKYYKAILQNLFFATLNVPLDERKWISGSRKNKAQLGDPLIYRFEKEFIDSEFVINEVFMKIPFLNGGLFDCLDDRPNAIFVDGFTKSETKQIKFSNYLFFGRADSINLSHHFDGDKDAVKKKWQKQNVKGIINILHDFKFTIEENTPLEVDVALDPELLGKVFENLLASFNPETKATARKQTGSFYTPREIVNYMVDESLKQHLKTHLPNNARDVDNLFLENTVKFDFDLNNKLISNLFNCKILDPACGSGAYPMGILHKMVSLMTVLDPENKYLKDVENKKYDDLIKNANQLLDVKQKAEVIIQFQKQKQILQTAPFDYIRKLFIIENCIYGIDIQPIAIQISKLRFFISLLVEQVQDASKDNFGIEPLPNMDFKLLAANSLIGIPDEDKNVGLFEDEFFEDFKVLAHDYFTMHSPSTKKLKKEEIKKLINVKINDKKKLIASFNKSAGLQSSIILWESYANIFKDKAVGFFEIPYFFPTVGRGFDVVIGNPPYVQKPKGIYSKTQFPFSEAKDKGKQNLYKVFVENSYNLLKENGVASMIVQSSLMCDVSSQFTRELLLTKTTIKEILEFPKKAKTKEGQVFDNVLQGTCIYNFTKSIPKLNQKFNVSIDNDVTTISKLKYEQLTQQELISIYPNGYFIPLVNENDFEVIQKLNSNSKPLNDFVEDISQGDINLTINSKYFNSKKTEIKLYRGKNINKYNLILDVDEYVDQNFKSDLVKVNMYNEFIVLQEITGTTDKFRIHATLTNLNEKYLFGHTANKILLNEMKFNRFIICILNSKLMDWYFRKTSTNNHVMGYEIKQLPIIIGDEKAIAKFEKIVDSILKAKKSDIIADHDTSDLENEIDIMVYKLYDLSYAEAKIIDGNLDEDYFNSIAP